MSQEAGSKDRVRSPDGVKARPMEMGSSRSGVKISRARIVGAKGVILLPSKGTKEKIAIIGAGPSGAYLARLLSDSGYKIDVFEGSYRLALKPCGWGVPYTIDSVLRLPEDAILVKVKGYKVYIGDKLIFESHARHYGYIIDKEIFLTELLSGIEVTRRWADPASLDNYLLVVDARGHVAYPGPKALALQVEGRMKNAPRDEVHLFFFPELVGYGWIFPMWGSHVKVGVGGKDRALVAGLFKRLVRTTGVEVNTPTKGSWIASGGLRLYRHRSYYRIGEAAGAVMPLTGEGIRPSLITAIAAYREIKGEGGFRETLAKYNLFLNIRIQMAILNALENASPEERAVMLEMTPIEVLERVSAGDVTWEFLSKGVFKWPRFFLRIALQGGLGRVLGLPRRGSGKEEENAT
ncbi:MAG: NAD(P)/FAD-dependent oxidoreductase [Infirmifilum sp.]